MASVVHIISGDLWGGSEAQMLLQLQALNVSALQVILFNKLETYNRYSSVGLKCNVIEENYGFFSLLSAIKKTVPQRSIIFAHGYKELAVASYLKFFSSCKVVAVFHGLREPQNPFFSNLKSKIYFFVYKFLAIFFADKIICVSEALKKSLRFDKATVIRNCVKLLPIKSNSKQPNAIPIIFMAGRLVPIKRYDLAILAVSELVGKLDLKLIIAGTGPEKNNLEQLAKSLGVIDNVEFLGFRNDIADLLTNSDIFLICSDSEGIPTILLEALASGLACIATSVGGIPEVVNSINSDCCNLVQSGNSKLISETIYRTINSEFRPNIDDVRKKIGSLYSPTRAAEEMLKLINNLS